MHSSLLQECLTRSLTVYMVQFHYANWIGLFGLTGHSTHAFLSFGRRSFATHSYFHPSQDPYMPPYTMSSIPALNAPLAFRDTVSYNTLYIHAILH